ncbi:NlpC/P60 family protein [Pseudonocardia phyllosphaerae]|uniref:NlpC/P60 family protein n=1 Tax=Pseudonocardia phyllosphaerae TaxID=3390502 RepID=UPI00397E7E3B
MKRATFGRLGAATLAALVGGTLMAGGTGVAFAGAGSDRLNPGETLVAGERLVSPDGQYVLVMQGDGNLVEYAPGNRAIWASGTNRANSVATMQGDGNLVVIAPGNSAVWATGTNGNNGADLELQNDGNAVVYAQGHVAKWSSRSGGTATNPRAEAAISWFQQRMGSTVYEGLCEKAVENAYGVSGKYPTARANWNSRDRRTPYSAAPRGALVFYNTSSAGHVAISLGDGRVISTSAGGRIGIVPIGYFQNPLGWAPSPW